MIQLNKSALLVLLLPLCAHAHVAPYKQGNVERSLESTAEAALQRVWEGIKCMGECRKTWGWQGNHFGADPWGGVLNIGDPLPYDPSQPSTPINNDSGSRNSQSASSTTSSTEGGFGILDVTTAPVRSSTTQLAAPSLVTLPRVTTRTSTSTSSTPTTTSTSSEEPSPTPEPEPETTTSEEPAPSPTPENNNNNNNNNNTGSSGSTSSSDREQYLQAHNQARAQHGASPVTWSDQLEGFAQEWANNCVFQHSGGKFGRVGENLAAGTGNYPIATAIGDWVAEVSDYNPSSPQASHFTQVVWKGTTQIGCAKATCGGIFGANSVATYYVCEYLDAGNVIGQFAANVQK